MSYFSKLAWNETHNQSFPFFRFGHPNFTPTLFFSTLCYFISQVWLHLPNFFIDKCWWYFIAVKFLKFLHSSICYRGTCFQHLLFFLLSKTLIKRDSRSSKEHILLQKNHKISAQTAYTPIIFSWDFFLTPPWRKHIYTPN